MKECLALSGATGHISPSTILTHRSRVSAKCFPAFDLSLVVRMPASHIVPTIPLKPSTRIVFVYPPLRFPIRKRFTCIYAKIIECCVTLSMTQLCTLKPTRRELPSAISHILAPKHTKSKHFLRRQIRRKIRVKAPPLRLGQLIGISLLHHVVYDNCFVMSPWHSIDVSKLPQTEHRLHAR